MSAKHVQVSLCCCCTAADQAIYCVVWCGVVWCCVALRYVMLRYVNYITLHYITLHYITLHYITLHYITLHYITLHYITYALHCIEGNPAPTHNKITNNVSAPTGASFMANVVIMPGRSWVL